MARKKRVERHSFASATPRISDTQTSSVVPLHKKTMPVILPRNVAQEDYLYQLANPKNSICFAIGPAGTGKTLLCTQMGIKAFMEREVKKIVITRPAVSVDEQHGFLPGDLNEKMAPWTRPIFDILEQHFTVDQIKMMLENNVIEIAPLAYMRGRAEPLDNLIPTPNGFVKMGDIQIGDKIFGSDGEQITVSGVFPQGKKDIYEITFSDGTTIQCSGDHLWNTKTLSEKRHNKPFSTKTTTQIMETLKTKHGQKNHEIPVVSAPVNYPSQEVSIDPYVMGCLLGDGNITVGSVTFSTADTEMIELIASRIPEEYSIKKLPLYDHRISRDYHTDEPTLQKKLKEYGLWGRKSYEKFIPDDYKFNNKTIRLEILRGLMDTDGSIFLHRSGKERMQFYTTSERLANDVKWIVETLGGVATFRRRKHKEENRKIKHKRDSFVIDFTLPENINPFKLTRKASRFNPTRVKRLIADVRYVGEKECQCISVDAPDSLYLTSESHLVTHNTFKDAWIIADEMQNATKAQMKMLLTRIGTGTKMVVTGDLKQHDRGFAENGLSDFLDLVKRYEMAKLEYIAISRFDMMDVERHPAVIEVLSIYGEDE